MDCATICYFDTCEIIKVALGAPMGRIHRRRNPGAGPVWDALKVAMEYSQEILALPTFYDYAVMMGKSIRQLHDYWGSDKGLERRVYDAGKPEVITLSPSCDISSRRRFAEARKAGNA